MKWLVTVGAGPPKQHSQHLNVSTEKTAWRKQNVERESAAKAYVYNILINYKRAARRNRGKGSK